MFRDTVLADSKGLAGLGGPELCPGSCAGELMSTPYGRLFLTALKGARDNGVPTGLPLEQLDLHETRLSHDTQLDYLVRVYFLRHKFL